MQAKAEPPRFLRATTTPGFLGIGAPELLRRLRGQACEYGAQLINGSVTSLNKKGEAFAASSSSGDADAIGGRPLNELLPGFAADVFHSGAGGLSILASATGAGAIIGGLWLGHSGHSSRLTIVAIGSSLVAALGAIAVSATTSMWLAVPAIAAFGFGVSSAGIAIQALIQLASDRKMRGRVMGLYGLIFEVRPRWVP